MAITISGAAGINNIEDLNMDSSYWRAYRQALRDSTENWVMPSRPL